MIKEFIEKYEKNFTFVQTGDVADWLEARKSGVGGSDAGSIMGMNKYGSQLTVYLDKKGFNTFTGNAATERGKIMEPVIRQYATKDLGIVIEELPYSLTSSNGISKANLDGICYATNPCEVDGTEFQGFAGHEIKTSRNGSDFGDKEIPDSHYCQVQHYMAVTGLRGFILSVYIIDTDAVKHYYIARNDIFIEQLMQAELDFWKEFVEKDIMPCAVGLDAEADMVNSMYKGLPTTVNLGDEGLKLCEERKNADEQEKFWKAEKDRCTLELKKMMAASTLPTVDNKGTAIAGGFNLSYSKSIRCTADGDALKRDGLFAKYSKESEVFTLRVTAPKGT